MAVHRLHIVALPYHDVKGCLDEFYAEAKGRYVKLRHEESNPYDSNAVMVFDWKIRRIGYVQSSECKLALEMMRLSGKGNLRALVTEVNSEHNCLTVEVVSDWDGKQIALPQNYDYEGWVYSGPTMLKPQIMDEIYFEMNVMEDDIDSIMSADGADYFRALIEKFCMHTKYDISAEMIDFRKQLKKRLEDKELYEEAEMVGREEGHAGREVSDGEVRDFWMRILTSHDKKSSLYAEREKYDVNEIRKQLKAFPNGLYEIWVNSPDEFVSKAYYMHIPKLVLWKFMSGIAFVELMKREGCDKEESVKEFVHRMVGVAKHSLKRNENALEGMRVVLSEMGYPDADKDLDAWMDNRDEVKDKSYTDEQIARAIENICGEKKPLNNKQLWAAVYWCLRWYCNFPVKGNDFCDRIAKLPFSRELEYECNYNNIRRQVTLSFMSQDARNMNVVKPSKTDETFFSQCRTVVLALVESLEEIAA